MRSIPASGETPDSEAPENKKIRLHFGGDFFVVEHAETDTETG